MKSGRQNTILVISCVAIQSAISTRTSVCNQHVSAHNGGSSHLLVWQRQSLQWRWKMSLQPASTTLTDRTDQDQIFEDTERLTRRSSRSDARSSRCLCFTHNTGSRANDLHQVQTAVSTHLNVQFHLLRSLDHNLPFLGKILLAFLLRLCRQPFSLE